MKSPAFQPVPVAKWEAYLLRLFFAIAAVWGMWAVLPFEKVEMANGLAYLLDLSFLGGDGAMRWFRPLIIIAAALYVLDVVNPLGVVLLTIAHVGYHTLQNSQGFTYHGNNIVGLILLTQCGAGVFWFCYRLVKGRAFAFALGLTRHSYQL